MKLIILHFVQELSKQAEISTLEFTVNLIHIYVCTHNIYKIYMYIHVHLAHLHLNMQKLHYIMCISQGNMYILATLSDDVFHV